MLYYKRCQWHNAPGRWLRGSGALVQGAGGSCGEGRQSSGAVRRSLLAGQGNQAVVESAAPCAGCRWAEAVGSAAERAGLRRWLVGHGEDERQQ